MSRAPGMKSPPVPALPAGVSDLAHRLRSRSRRMTEPRAAILDALKNARRPLTNREIWQSLRLAQCDLATVYRSMRTLEEAGLVRRCEFGNGGIRYELRPEDDSAHGHHLVCNQCAEVVPVRECFPEKLESEIARRNGFVQVTHRLEFFGICPRCQDEPA